MITFVSVLFAGDKVLIPRPNLGYYSPVWVDRLYRGVRRGMKGQPFRFVCLVDRDDYEFEEAAIEPVRLKYPNRGWMSIVEAHRPDVGQGGKIFNLGLDTVILGDLTALAGFEGTLAGTLPLGKARFKICNAICIASGEENARLWEIYEQNVDYWNRTCPGPHSRPSEMIFQERNMLPSWQFVERVFPGSIACWRHWNQVLRRPIEDYPSLVYFAARPKQSDLPEDHMIHQAWLDPYSSPVPLG